MYETAFFCDFRVGLLVTVVNIMNESNFLPTPTVP